MFCNLIRCFEGLHCKCWLVYHSMKFLENFQIDLNLSFEIFKLNWEGRSPLNTVKVSRLHEIKIEIKEWFLKLTLKLWGQFSASHCAIRTALTQSSNLEVQRRASKQIGWDRCASVEQINLGLFGVSKAKLLDRNPRLANSVTNKSNSVNFHRVRFDPIWIKRFFQTKKSFLPTKSR